MLACRGGLFLGDRSGLAETEIFNNFEFQRYYLSGVFIIPDKNPLNSISGEFTNEF